jgi:hypothetical protein
MSGQKFGISGHAWRWPPSSILRRPPAEFLMPPPHRRLQRSATPGPLQTEFTSEKSDYRK